MSGVSLCSEQIGNVLFLQKFCKIFFYDLIKNVHQVCFLLFMFMKVLEM